MSFSPRASVKLSRSCTVHMFKAPLRALSLSKLKHIRTDIYAQTHLGGHEVVDFVSLSARQFVRHLHKYEACMSPSRPDISAIAANKGARTSTHKFINVPRGMFYGFDVSMFVGRGSQ